MDSALAQERVREYWNGKPCESELSDLPRCTREYFLDIERRRYESQPHILEIQSKLEWKGKRVLEIGTGLGTDARRIIGMGGVYTGINVDRASTAATLQALRAFFQARRRIGTGCDVARFPGQLVRCGLFVRGSAPYSRRGKCRRGNPQGSQAWRRTTRDAL